MNRLVFDRSFSIVLRQLYLMRGSLSRVLPLFVWVGVDIVLWGFITKYLNSVSASGVSFVPSLLGAVLLWDFQTRVMQGMTTAFFEDVWSRNFLNLFATPLTVGEYLLGLIMTSVMTSAVGLIVMMVLATTLFGLSVFSYGVMLFPFLMILFLTGIAFGVFGCSVVLRWGPAAEWFIWPIPALISPFVGVFYPLSTLPQWMRGVSHILPPSYVFEGMRTIVNHGRVPLGTLLIGGLLSLAYIVGAGVLFTRTYRQALRNGLIARYSAESVS
jgi:ABC-2 type transport system permease protein